jgi:hypothetical protein
MPLLVKYAEVQYQLHQSYLLNIHKMRRTNYFNYGVTFLQNRKYIATFCKVPLYYAKECPSLISETAGADTFLTEEDA